MRPSTCGDCYALFMADKYLQIEMIHLAKVHGHQFAEREFNERYERYHEAHESERPPREEGASPGYPIERSTTGDA